MEFLRSCAIVGACVFLWACSPGGGGEGSAGTAPAAMAKRAAALPPVYETGYPPVTRAELYAWAEATYPAQFSGAHQDGTYEVYDYRYYPATGNYLGFHGDRVLMLGPVSGWVLTYVGHLLDFSCLARPDLCATDRPRSDMQVRWDAMAAMPTSYSTFASIGAPPTNWFYVSRAMPNRPRATASGAAMNWVTGTHGPVGGPPVPAGFMNCEAPWLRILVDERGYPAKLCDNAAFRMQYVGDAIYATALSDTGQPVARYQMTSLTEQAIDGLFMTTWLRESVDVLHPLKQVLPIFRQFPVSSRGGTALAQRLTGIVFLLNADGSEAASIAALVPMDKAGSPGTPAQTLEDVFGPLGADDVDIVNGRRARFANVAAPALNAGAIQIDGRVYKAQYQYPDPVSRPFQVFLNAFARNAVLLENLQFIP